MSKTLFYSVLILLILLNGMGYSIIQAHFYLEREEITALYCVNKDLPELKCDGKCELGKRLSEAKNQKAGQTTITLKELRLIFIEQTQISTIAHQSKITPDITFTSFYKMNLSTSLEIDFFHPPQI